MRRPSWAQCGTCVFWEQTADRTTDRPALGECRRRPPQMSVKTGDFLGGPVTPEYYYCGELRVDQRDKEYELLLACAPEPPAVA